MSIVRGACLVWVFSLVSFVAEAQPLGTFRWRTEPFCNVLTLNVTQNGSIFTLDGFDEQCDGNPRLPVHGIAVMQPNGTITLGLSVVNLPGGQPVVNLEAGINAATVSGTWRDSAGNNGTLTFNPTSISGGPRGGPIIAAPLPSTFFLSPNGNFVAVAGPQSDVLPISGIGTRMMWYASRGAFRAGRSEGPEWDDQNLGFYSAAFGIRSAATGTGSFAAGIDVGAVGAGGVALGTSAVSQGAGSFTFGDRSTSNAITSGANQFNARAVGGFGFYTNAALTMGVELRPNSSQFTHLSDVNAKEHFRDLDPQELLEKIARMPVREWSYKAQGPSIRHVGPTAQDFHAAFGLGEDPLRIGTLDADGIALAGVKALEARTRALDARNAALEAALAELHAQLEALLERRR